MTDIVERLRDQTVYCPPLRDEREEAAAEIVHLMAVCEAQHVEIERLREVLRVRELELEMARRAWNARGTLGEEGDT